MFFANVADFLKCCKFIFPKRRLATLYYVLHAQAHIFLHLVDGDDYGNKRRGHNYFKEQKK